MKRTGNHQEQSSYSVEHTPQHQHTDHYLHSFHDARKMKTFHHRWRIQLCQTTGTQHPILIFAHTFPAKESLTFRTASDGLARSVIITPLVRKFHSLYFFPLRSWRRIFLAKAPYKNQAQSSNQQGATDHDQIYSHKQRKT